MARPIVSVITPSYNQAPFLEQTLCSVLDQDYPLIEYHVMDGGSSDASPAIISRYAPRLASWVSEKDNGQAEAINKGFARATGEIIAWINSDDYYLPGAIRAAVEAFEEHPSAALVFADVLSVDGAGKPFNLMRAGNWGLDDLLQFRILAQPGVFMRRATLEQAGYLDTTFHYLLDHHLWLRIARLAPIRHVPGRWAAARFHDTAKNVSQAARFGTEADRIVEWVAQDPAYAGEWQRLEKPIRAGADRIAGYYLLEAGQPREALRRYLHGLRLAPRIILPEWRRVAYAALSPWLPLEGFRRGWKRRKAERLNRGDDA